MSSKYKIQDQDQDQIYFLTFTIVNWLDVFTRIEYKEHTAESRRELFLWLFQRAGKRNKQEYQFWQPGSHPIELNTNELLQQKLDYLHENPVKAGFVSNPEDYLYSSAVDYADGKGLLPVSFIE